MTIYQRIKGLASEKNISIRELESTLKLANGTLSKWKDRANTEKLQKVATFFNVSVDYLLGNVEKAENDNGTKRVNIEELLDGTAMLTDRDGELTDSDRAALRTLISTYLQTKEGRDRLKKYSNIELDDDNNGENGDD